MAVLKYTRNDIEVLATRITSRASTLGVRDAQWAADMTAAGKLLKWMLSQGVPPTSAEIENGGK
jgi:hypothetical protein